MGGSLENRSRLLLEVVAAVRAVVGPSFAISVKLNSGDFQQGGFTPDEAVHVSCLLERAGIDLLEISGGNYESGIFGDGDGDGGSGDAADLAAGRRGKRSTTVAREAYFLKYAVAVRNALRTLPVMVTGGWRSLAAMESALGKGAAASPAVPRRQPTVAPAAALPFVL